MATATNLATGRRDLRMRFGLRGWLLVALAIIGAGAVLKWSWLTAIGAAPLILSFAPCAAMCAAGVCMTGGSKACASKSIPAPEPGTTRD